MKFVRGVQGDRPNAADAFLHCTVLNCFHKRRAIRVCGECGLRTILSTKFVRRVQCDRPNAADAFLHCVLLQLHFTKEEPVEFVASVVSEQFCQRSL